MSEAATGSTQSPPPKSEGQDQSTAPKTLSARLATFSPFNQLPPAARDEIAGHLQTLSVAEDAPIFAVGDTLPGLFLLEQGAADVISATGDVISHRSPGDSLGDRGLMRNGPAMLQAKATEDSTLLLLPAKTFRRLLEEDRSIARWFGQARQARISARSGTRPDASGLMSLQVRDLMTAHVITCAPEATARDAAWIMRDQRINALLVMQDHHLRGIVTVHDLVNKVLAEGRSGNLLVRDIMSPRPVTILPEASGLDALMIMSERRIHHLPVCSADGRVDGILGHSDLFRQQAATASHMASEIVTAGSASAMAEVMQRLPELLANLTSVGTRPEAICRRMTDLTDAVTRRLLTLAEEKLGPAPVPYVWAACGSQGRREQTGVSDQDNCLILDERATPKDDAYFAELAQFVSDGLNEVGFVYCPGNMMATNPDWRQPVAVWRGYFRKWITEPDNMAQMLASVMFDLRPIFGDARLFTALQAETMDLAQKNSIFIRQMVGNSLKHAPPLGFFRNLALIRSGAHKDRLDLKHAGVVPVVDLARVYALKAGIYAANTRDRLQAASEMGVLSEAGAKDLIDAYDMILETRLRHQAAQIADGQHPDNYLDPMALSELERNHLRDAFLVVKTLQSALSSQM